MTRAEIIAALETAQGASDSLFREAFKVCRPQPTPACNGPLTDEDYAWFVAFDRFNSLVMNGAYLDAAMMLLPPDAEWSLDSTGVYAVVNDKTGAAATPANALAAACLRAGGE